MTILNEGRSDDTSSLLAKDALPAEHSLMNTSAQLCSTSNIGIFKSESERKEQTATSTLPGLQIGDFLKGNREDSSSALRLINADLNFPNPNQDPNYKPERSPAGSKVWQSYYLDPFKPTVDFKFPGGAVKTVDMPPAERGQLVNFTFVSQAQGGYCLEASAGNNTWILKQSGWTEVAKK